MKFASTAKMSESVDDALRCFWRRGKFVSGYIILPRWRSFCYAATEQLARQRRARSSSRGGSLRRLARFQPGGYDPATGPESSAMSWPGGYSWGKPSDRCAPPLRWRRQPRPSRLHPWRSREVSLPNLVYRRPGRPTRMSCHMSRIHRRVAAPESVQRLSSPARYYERPRWPGTVQPGPVSVTGSRTGRASNPLGTVAGRPEFPGTDSGLDGSNRECCRRCPATLARYQAVALSKTGVDGPIFRWSRIFERY